MITIYGSEQCPKTMKILETCRERGIEVNYINLEKDLKNIWKFVIMRDKYPAFDGARKNERLGIPCIICANGVLFDGGEEPFNVETTIKKITENRKEQVIIDLSTAKLS